ncbi:MAG TPA: type I methionyl aminopeptidase [Candidatus Acidoferrales bacterium]|nr:type I methionyl aminopeptidase [Candidatus Acidoferrales bacterium]
MIICRSSAELETMHRAGMIVWGALSELRKMVKPGVSTLVLDEFAEGYAKEHGGRPAFKGYHGYPKSLCTSINQEVVHGIPSAKRTLREGDILSMDFGVELDGYFADAALTVPVGKVDFAREKLLRVTREALERGIAQMKAGNRLSDISAAVQSWVEENGLSIVREFVGHSIGTKMHEDLQLPNYGEPGHGPKLQKGMVLAIEPMVNSGGPAVRVLDDQWTAVTRDGSDSAHFEHTVAITDNGPWILTRPREVAGPVW